MQVKNDGKRRNEYMIHFTPVKLIISLKYDVKYLILETTLLIKNINLYFKLGITFVFFPS